MRKRKSSIIMVACLAVWWCCATPVAGLHVVHGTGAPARYPATVEAEFTPEALELTAILPHPDLNAIHCMARSTSDRVWEDESVEFFLALPSGGTEDYLHFSVNQAGVIAGARGSMPLPAEAISGVSATVGTVRSAGCWTLRLSIPWKLASGVPAPGEKRKFNFLRTVKSNDKTLEISSWSQLDLGAHEVWNFGDLIRSGDSLKLEPKSPQMLPLTIPNGGFEDNFEGWAPGTWAGGDMYGDGNFSHRIEAVGVEGRQALVITGTGVGRPRMEAARMGATSVPVHLTPGTYVLEGYYRGSAEGEMPIPGQFASVYAVGGNQEIFLAASPGWKRFECIFELEKAGDVAAMLRLWSNGNVYFDGIHLRSWSAPQEEPGLVSSERIVDGMKYTLIQNELEQPAPEAVRRVATDGIALFQRPPEKLQPDSAPGVGELCDRLSDFTIPGVPALQFLNIYGTGEWRLRLDATGTLSPDWLTISRIPFWLQRTDYDGKQIRAVAEVLYPMAKDELLTVTAESLGVLALQWEIPIGTPPGMYHGELVFTSPNASREVRLPIELEIGGFRLPEGQPGFGLWVAPTQIPQVLEYAVASDIRFASFPVPLQLTLNDAGKVQLDASEAIARLQAAERAGMGFPIPIELSTLSSDLARLLGLYEELPKDETFDSRHLICPPDEAAYPAALTEAYQEAIRQLYRQLDEAGLMDKVLFYPVDEPTSNPHRMYKAKHEGALIKALFPQVRIFMTAHDLVRTEQLAQAGVLDVVCLGLGTLHSNPEWAARFYQMAERNALEVWGYTGSTAEDYSRMRLLGWQCAAQKLQRLMLWVSYFDTASVEDEWNDLRAKLKRVATFYPAPAGKGYLSTIQWEGLRQARIDLAYWQAALEVGATLPEEEAARWRMELQAGLAPFGAGAEADPEDCQRLRRMIFERLNQQSR